MEEIFCQNDSVFCNPEVKRFLPRIQPTSPLDERVERYQSKMPALPEFRPGSLGSSSSGVGQRYQFVPSVHEARLNFTPGAPNAAIRRCVSNYLNADAQADEEAILAPEVKKRPVHEPILEPAVPENTIAIATAHIAPEPEVVNMSLVLADDAPPPKRFLDKDPEEELPEQPSRRPARITKPPAPLPYDAVLATTRVEDDYDYNSDEEDFSDLEYEKSAPTAQSVRNVTYDEPEVDSEKLKQIKEAKRKQLQQAKTYGVSELKIGDMPSIQKFNKHGGGQLYEMFKDACTVAFRQVAAELLGGTSSNEAPELTKTLVKRAHKILLPCKYRSDKMLRLQKLCLLYATIDFLKDGDMWRVTLGRPQTRGKPATHTFECDEDAAIAIQYLHTALYPYPFILESVRNTAASLLEKSTRIKTPAQLCDALAQNETRAKNWFVQWCVASVLAGIPEFSPI